LGNSITAFFLLGRQQTPEMPYNVTRMEDAPIGWLVALLSKDNLRKCPFCAENVKPEAKACRYCGREIPLLAGRQ